MDLGTRAQTSVDFAIAMGIFLVALTTIVAFMPTIIQPFTGGQENPLSADRLSAQLVDGHLGDPSNPSHLDTTCTLDFFREALLDTCDSFDSSHNVTAKLGVDHDVFVNVTIQQNVTGGPDPEIVCAEDPGATDLYEPPCNVGDTLMVEGEDPPNEAGSVTLARRTAVLNEQRVYVVVKVWT